MKHETKRMRRQRMLYESIRTVAATLLLLAAALLTFAWFHHGRPKQRLSAGLVTATPTPAVIEAQSTPTPSSEAHGLSPSTEDPGSAEPSVTPEPTPVYVPWIEKYAERFSSDIVSTGEGYSSPDLSVRITKVQYGKAKSATYYLADIYLTDVFQLESVLAKDKYGSGLRESESHGPA